MSNLEAGLLSICGEFITCGDGGNGNTGIIGHRRYSRVAIFTYFRNITMRWIFACIFAFVARTVVAQTNSTKNATALCLKREQANTFEMILNVDLNSDPEGDLWALNNTLYSKTVFEIGEVPCLNTYNSTNKVYTITSVVDLNTGSTANDANTCGRVVKTDTVMYYEWLFMHLTVPPLNSSYPVLIGNADRVYKIACRLDNLTSDRLTTMVEVQTPNLLQNVPITSLDVTLVIQRKTGTTTYVDVASGSTLQAGTTVRMMAKYNRPSNYLESTNVHSIFLYDTIMSPYSNLTNYLLFVDELGCANTNASNKRPASFITVAFKGSINGNTNELVTGDFILVKFETSPNLYFRTFFGTCFFPNVAKCADPCLFNTNLNEGAGIRKRRQANNEEEEEDTGVLTYYINIRDADDFTTTAESASDTKTLLITVVTVGAVLLLVLCVLICAVVMMRRRSVEKKPRTPSFVVVAPPPYKQKF